MTAFHRGRSGGLSVFDRLGLRWANWWLDSPTIERWRQWAFKSRVSDDELRDLISTLWLYLGRHAETQLTTEQKELYADVVEYELREHGQSDFTFDRWWR